MITPFPTPLKSQTVVLIEDDELLQTFLQKALGRYGYDVHGFINGESLIDFLLEKNVDLIILDRILPGRDGIFWLQWLRQYYPHIPVLMVSVRNSEDDRLLGLEQGARDYVIKPFHEKELILRIENVFSHCNVYMENKYIGDIEFNPQYNYLKKNGEKINLTPIETNILKILYNKQGQTVSRDEFMQQIRGAEHHPFDRSIDVHINSLRKKIETNPREPIHLRTVWGKGYQLFT